jgi:hypothetical protein
LKKQTNGIKHSQSVAMGCGYQARASSNCLKLWQIEQIKEIEMLTNEIKKGMRVKLSAFGSMGEYPRWQGEVWDNAKGNIRVVNVEGWVTEAGSVYAHDIEFCKPTPESDWVKVEHTPAQLKLRDRVRAMGF